jgi:hypothetical protein
VIAAPESSSPSDVVDETDLLRLPPLDPVDGVPLRFAWEAVELIVTGRVSQSSGRSPLQLMRRFQNP